MPAIPMFFLASVVHGSLLIGGGGGLGGLGGGGSRKKLFIYRRGEWSTAIVLSY